ncbi:MAG: cysteine desulfurase NifS [Clostridiales bacterium]|nr:cysteine desulfurase NifS [Clostridiales bacterium]
MKIYLDHAATTYVKPQVLSAMMPYFTEHYGNPGGVHSYSRTAKAALDDARAKVAAVIGAQSDEIYFTAGGSESDNLCIRGIAKANAERKGKHIITTNIEHHAVLHTCEALEKEGYEVTYLSVDGMGKVTAEQVRDAIRPDTVLVTIMFANNEIGTIEPIREIGAVCKEKGVFFHTDAVQAFGSVPIDVKEMNIDALSISGHKLYGPKGIGAMYVRRGLRMAQVLTGGAQERNRRPGTENIPGIVGLGEAAKLAHETMEQNAKQLTELRNYLIDGVLSRIPFSRLNGSREDRLPNNASFCFEFVEGEGLLLMLDLKGIAAASGSACTSGSLDPSHVLLAIGLPHEIAHGSLRLTLGTDTTREDIDYVLETLPPIVERLRMMSPLYNVRKDV